jgi:thymidylate synthase
MNKLDKQYQDLLQDILDNGVEKKDRTQTGTISVFGRQIRHKMSEGFPLLTTKKMPFKTIVTELLWFLRGDTNIKFLVDNNCHIWDGDAYKNYWEYNKMQSNPKWLKPVTYSNGNVGAELYNMEEFINKIKTDDEFAKKWGELGPIYGAGWRRWNSITKKWWDDPEYQGYGSDSRSGWEYEETQIDQIQNLINDLKTNPDSRRLMVNAWNCSELDQMVLPPCHYGFQVYTRELSVVERMEYYGKHYMKENETKSYDELLKVDYDELNIPTRAISLMFNMRSVDTFLGLPFNIASYGLLLEIIAKEVNMVPDELIGNLGDVHLYSNHIEQAKEQIGKKYTHEERTELLKQAMGEERYNKSIDELMPFGGGLSEYYDSYKIPYRTREPYRLPTLKKLPDYLCIKESWECYEIDDIQIDNYQSHPTIKAPLSN